MKYKFYHISIASEHMPIPDDVAEDYIDHCYEKVCIELKKRGMQYELENIYDYTNIYLLKKQFPHVWEEIKHEFLEPGSTIAITKHQILAILQFAIEEFSSEVHDATTSQYSVN